MARGDRANSGKRMHRSVRSLPCAEIVQVSGATSAQPPARFCWRGRHYVVRSLVENSKCRSPQGQDRRAYAVKTTSGLNCVLEHRGESGVWVMTRVMAGSSGGVHASRNVVV